MVYPSGILGFFFFFFFNEQFWGGRGKHRVTLNELSGNLLSSLCHVLNVTCDDISTHVDGGHRKIATSFGSLRDPGELGPIYGFLFSF